jgi:hypothetical protein
LRFIADESERYGISFQHLFAESTDGIVTKSTVNDGHDFQVLLGQAFVFGVKLPIST